MSIEGVNNKDVILQNSKIVQKPEAMNRDFNIETKKNTITVSNSKESQTDSQNMEALNKAVKLINKKMGNTECRYSIHEATNSIVIKFVDKDTNQIVKEFPPEEQLDIVAKVWELAGLMVDEKR